MMIVCHDKTKRKKVELFLKKYQEKKKIYNRFDLRVLQCQTINEVNKKNFFC